MPRPEFLRRFALIAGLGCLAAASATAVELSVGPSGAAISGAPLTLSLSVEDARSDLTFPVEVYLDGEVVERRELPVGDHSLKVGAPLEAGAHSVRVESGEASAVLELETISGWLSVVPPLVAIALALIFKDVLLSLFLGIFFGALFLNGWNPIIAFARAIDQFVAPSLADSGNASILIFTTLLGGMVGVISKCGGTQGLVDALTKYATNARRGQLATWVMGILVFFDDYANTLIVGSTMRPITDRLRISREKLAYVVDSTAAPVASLVPISTWIGFEVGLIAAAFTQLDLPYNAYVAFVGSIPYRFYPILALVLGFTIAYTCRDFGPMLKAERRAAKTGALVAVGDTPLADYDGGRLSPPEDAPKRPINALLPILTVISITMVGLFATGSAAVRRADYPTAFKWLQDVFSNADSTRALLWASLAGVTVALALALGQRILTVKQGTSAMVQGFSSMLLALVVLILAWSLGAVCAELHTADYLVELTQGVVSPQWLPVMVFLLSAATAFATGTSWGTMGILMPLVIPIAHGLSLESGMTVTDERFYLLLLGTISGVLAGSVWGDHCSPISDTTILSSMASGCDHIAHVRTQMPYAVTVGVIAMLLGDVPSAYGLSPWISIVVGAAVLVGIVLWRGKPSKAES
ncbi:MAG: Na+/H+ antiporter NhaC family protein [bacterium]|nr:Na+/H+ antiporter NhaC family protein [bacterium]